MRSGSHVANIWTATGTNLATTTFTSDTPSGWQQVDFATPVTVQEGETYVASYHTRTGFYSADVGYFSTQGVDVGLLHAPASPLVSGGNGVYAYGASAFPSNTWNGSNYWVPTTGSTWFWRMRNRREATAHSATHRGAERLSRRSPIG
jgi:hypothetical protein